MNVYYLRFQVDGKRRKVALKDDEGNPITNRPECPQSGGYAAGTLRGTD